MFLFTVRLGTTKKAGEKRNAWEVHVGPHVVHAVPKENPGHVVFCRSPPSKTDSFAKLNRLISRYLGSVGDFTPGNIPFIIR